MTKQLLTTLAHKEAADIVGQLADNLINNGGEYSLKHVNKIRRPSWTMIGNGKSRNGIKSVDGISLVANLSKTAIPLFLDIYHALDATGYSHIQLTWTTRAEQVAQQRAIKLLKDSDVAKRIGSQDGFTHFILNPYAFCQSSMNESLRKAWDSLP